MQSLLNAGELDLADRYASIWFFGQVKNQPPCYPTWAFGGSPTINDYTTMRTRRLQQRSATTPVSDVDTQNTLTADEANAEDAKDQNGVKNNDHPKVYVSWPKHANFGTRKTEWNNPASQSLEIFSSQKWWYFVAPRSSILSDDSTDADKAIGPVDWEKASSNPPSAQPSVCDAL
ncbi:hypothetical protein N7508_011048 [Penicillium antarcticum]|uniref:uncharacterized protein n=1 Tax=Penicillium antarcticum TaxID=416450 RepID=UPI00239ABF37|nr:uncharacterized protein N7508_011048 [Penicillium antarcticum]KAJ5288273.1 hypothetical protein N7508_011048 [Penicillium antarcticum]